MHFFEKKLLFIIQEKGIRKAMDKIVYSVKIVMGEVQNIRRMVAADENK